MSKLNYPSTSRSSVQLSDILTSHRRSVKSQEERDLGYVPLIPEDSVSSAAGDIAMILWNEHDMSLILTCDDGRSLRYKPSRNSEDYNVAAARGNHPMLPRAARGIYYYEVTVIDKGEEGKIGVGFCCATTSINRQPGWDKDSWGYHGDDGMSYAAGFGTPYGPFFSTGDVIGCGIDFTIHKAFYTKNGTLLGYAFDNIGEEKTLYPAVGLHSMNESIKANFGQDPFKYDIDVHRRCARAQQMPFKII